MPHWLKKFTNFLEEQDNFGEDVKFNFASKGNQYKTFIGGIFSIGTNIVFTVYIIELFRRFSDPNYNSILTINKDANYTEIGEL